MNKTARKTLCLFVMLGLLLPIMTRGELSASAYAEQDTECSPNDDKCKAEAFNRALESLAPILEEGRKVAQIHLSHLSDLFDIPLAVEDPSLQIKLKNLLPNMTKVIEESLARRHGISLPLKIPGQKEAVTIVVIGIVAAVLTILVSVAYLADLIDNNLNQAFINAVIRDLEAQGWPGNLAAAEANYQWTQRSLTYLQALSPAVMLSRLVKIIGSGDYYTAWARQNHDELVRYLGETLRNRQRNKEPVEDFIRSGGTAGVPSVPCRLWVYFPGNPDFTFVTVNGVRFVRRHGEWRCVVR